MARIAFVEFSPSGGLFQFAAQLGEALAEQGHDVHLYTGPRPELSAGHPGFRIHAALPTWHPLDEKPRGPLLRKARRVLRAGQLVLAWLVLLARLRRDRPDAVFFSTWRFALDALGVLALDRLLPRATLGIVAHEPRVMTDADTTKAKAGPVFDRALPAAWRAMDLCFTLGDEARDRLLKHWRPSGPVIVIPHGDESALRGDAPVPPVSGTRPVALFFGLWTAYKGIDVLLDAWPAVRAAVPDAELVVAGAIGGADRAAIEAKARAAGGVTTRPGYVPNTEIPALFGAARVVTIPYLRASQSGVAHLAFTFDRPVVATTVGDIPKVVRDGVSGLLAPPGDAPALAEALIALLSDSGRAEEYGRAGAEWLAETSSWTAVARRFSEGLAGAQAPGS
ncbi:glycosyltransferase family 4 protein [Pseudonocardia lacus]|uniref:glycosyltransferase family 4 protein n=1 Tax=Pseudonocardia lacus TaxID=2835865 RepID=UPI001BDCDA4E|nr:glycosyltransferase family 4 protein [Pseudonocardia lacus]